MTEPELDLDEDFEPPRSGWPTAKVVTVALVIAGGLLSLGIQAYTASSANQTKRFTRQQTIIVAQQRLDAEVGSCRAAYNVELVSAPQAVALKTLADFGVDSPEFRVATDAIKPEEATRLTQLSRTDPAKFLRACRQPVTAPGSNDPPVTSTTRPGSKPYTSCAAAALAGRTPLHRDDPGYSPRLDSDGDGIACE